MLNAFEEKIRVKTLFEKSTVYFSWLIFGHSFGQQFYYMFYQSRIIIFVILI